MYVIVEEIALHVFITGIYMSVKNISILIGSGSHYECVGFLLDALADSNVTVYHTADTYCWLNYFSKVYKFNIKHINTLEYTDDAFIKLSETDNININDNNMKKTIVLVHGHNDVNYSNSITLSPMLRNAGSKNNYYNMIPVYNVLDYLPCKKNNNTIIYIGLIESHYFTKDLIKLIKMCPVYKFLIIGRRKRTNVVEHIKTLNLPNIEIKMNVPTEELDSYIKDSSFVMCRRYPFQCKRFTGAISLALSYGRPLILQAKYSCAYKVPAISFDEQYGEIINEINTMTDEKYEDLVNKTCNFAEEQKNNNCENMKAMLDVIAENTK